MNLKDFHSRVFGQADMARRIIVVVAMTVSAVRILFETRNCYFFSDDFLNFIIAQDMGPTWRYFMRDAQGELIPFYRAVNLIYFDLFRLAFWPFRTMLVCFQWAVIVLIAGLAKRRSMRPQWLFPILTLVACTPIFDTPYQWWSASLNVLWEALAVLIAIRLMANTSALTSQRKYGAVLAYLTGVFFFPKALFAAAILLGIRVYAALEQGESRVRAVGSAALDVWPVFLAGFAYTGVVVVSGIGSHLKPPSALVVLQYIWHGWNHGFLTGVLGLDRGFFGRVALANLVVAAVIGASVWRRPNALVLWLGFGVYFVAALGTTAFNRATMFGIESSEWGRYYADILCFAVALLVVSGAGAARLGGSASGRLSVWMSAALSMAGGAYLSLAIVRVPYLWFVPPLQVAGFIDNVAASIAHAPDHARIEQGVVPAWVMPQWTFPLSEYHYFLLLFPSHLTAVPADDAQFRFTGDGHLIAAKRP